MLTLTSLFVLAVHMPGLAVTRAHQSPDQQMPTSTIPLDFIPGYLAFSSDGSSIAIGGSSELRVVSLKTFVTLASYKTGKSRVISLDATNRGFAWLLEDVSKNSKRATTDISLQQWPIPFKKSHKLFNIPWPEEYELKSAVSFDQKRCYVETERTLFTSNADGSMLANWPTERNERYCFLNNDLARWSLNSTRSTAKFKNALSIDVKDHGGRYQYSEVICAVPSEGALACFALGHSIGQNSRPESIQLYNRSTREIKSPPFYLGGMRRFCCASLRRPIVAVGVAINIFGDPSGAGASKIYLIDVSTLSIVGVLDIVHQIVFGAAISPDGTKLAIRTFMPNEVQIYDVSKLPR